MLWTLLAPCGGDFNTIAALALRLNVELPENATLLISQSVPLKCRSGFFLVNGTEAAMLSCSEATKQHTLAESAARCVSLGAFSDYYSFDIVCLSFTGTKRRGRLKFHVCIRMCNLWMGVRLKVSPREHVRERGARVQRLNRGYMLTHRWFVRVAHGHENTCSRAWIGVVDHEGAFSYTYSCKEGMYLWGWICCKKCFLTLSLEDSPLESSYSKKVPDDCLSRIYVVLSFETFFDRLLAVSLHRSKRFFRCHFFRILWLHFNW